MTLSVHLVTNKQSDLPQLVKNVCVAEHWSFSMSRDNLPDHQHIDFSAFDVVVYDTAGNFDTCLSSYRLLLSNGQIHCSTVFVSQHYCHSENEALAGLSDAHYLVQPELSQLKSYLRKFTRSRPRILDKYNALLHGELGLLLDKTSIISIADMRGRIVYVNDKFCSVSGYTKKELIGENHRILKSGIHPADTFERMWQTISSGNTWQGQVCNRKKDGSLYWVKSEIHPICDGNGRPILYFSIRQEITQEVDLTQQLAINEERFRLSNAFANIVSFEWHFDSGIIHVSDEAQKLYGLQQPTNTLTHSKALSMIHPDDREEALQRANSSKTYNGEYKVEHRIIGEDGKTRWVAKRGRVILDQHNQPIKMLGVVSDIQEIKEAQAREEKANRIKTAFLTSLAHEVRNPLNAISGYSQLIRKKPDHSNVGDWANHIVDICQYMIELLTEVDDLSKIEAGKIELNIETIQVSELLQECQQIISPLLGDIKLFQDDTCVAVSADRRQLKQVLINLLSNAVKYNKELGRIFVSAKTLDNGYVRIEVEDTGNGIEEDMLEQIFVPFERLHWEKSEVQGLGLGLPLSKLLVEKMGGAIGVSSQAGLGTRMWVELPEVSTAATPMPERADDSDDTREHQIPAGTRILLAEDNEFNQHFITEQLALYGVEVDQAMNGKDALQQLQTSTYDLMLTDCNMPKMDGFELTKQVRSHASAALRELPIIAITARSSKRSLQECQSAGMNDVLIKPILAEDLLEKILKYLPGPEPRQKRITPSLPSPQCESDAPEVTPPAGHKTTDTRDTQIIDRSILNGYIGDDSQAQIKLLKIFQGLLKSAIEQLLSAWQNENYVDLQFIAHKLSSSSLSIGATPLASSLRGIEDDIQRDDLTGLANYIDHIKYLTPLLQHELEQLIDDATDSKKTDNTDNFAKATQLSVLIIDDDVFAISHAEHQLHKIGLRRVQSATSVSEALEIMSGAAEPFDVLMCDINMPDTDGLELIRLLSSSYRHEGLVIYSSEKNLIKPVRNLITSYNMNFLGHLEKPFRKPDLIKILKTQLHTPAPHAHIRQEPLTDKEVREGVKQDALEVVYQPQVCTSQQRIVGVEALARFRRSSGSLVGPAQFIPQIERMGLEHPFTISIFEKAVGQLATWMANGIDITMAVNFSMSAIENLELPGKLASICAHHGISTDLIVVEVTETEITKNPQVALEVLSRMSLQGFTLSIDDFGTGYSSLEKLQTLPFSELKLDRSYVSTAGQEEVSMAIMKSSIELAKQLNMRTVAEGVENPADVALSHEIGVDYIQGYHIAKPMPADALTQWIEQHLTAQSAKGIEYAEHSGD